MPHIVLEYSSNLPELPDFHARFDDIHQALNRIGGIRLENCKSRARSADHYYIGDGNPAHACVHLDVEFVKERSAEIKKAIGQACLELVNRYYHSQLSDVLQITVKIDDIALDSYFKDPAGTLNYQ